MRFRSSAGAALGALALILTVPTSASAATGEFEYTYTGLNGMPQTAKLVDPESRVCHTLPEVADDDASNPAHSPRNRTDSTVTVFTEAECEGAYFTLRPGGQASERLKMRSAIFS
ncbi:peptidase inhibitor family I36 protein [Streptomyces aurantiacus]|uniref:Uncharacterized protein n=1 Tax=Streptomyces aurantiacus JA 4570 TaxID=1286094 RepID=S3ZC79_9ACTN|nr:peptidase inhibitor family I36 protein [Streptomyces aurantiacus]EPH40224.1 hypothetical protein STRAU_6718 [Streptomyces aurantiacus JA 4570]